MRWLPRTVRWQLILWLMLLETLSVGLFAVILVKVEGQEIRRRALERLAHQATSVALQAEEAYRQQRPELVFPSLRMMGEAPSVARARITDTAGDVLFVSSGDAAHSQLEPAEKAQIALIHEHRAARIFVWRSSLGRREGHLRRCERARLCVGRDRSRLGHGTARHRFARLDFRLALIWIGASGLLVLLMSRSISRPLSVLQRGTRALMEGPGIEREFSAAGDGG